MFYAILNGARHALQSPAMQMPDVSGMMDMGTDKGRALADVMIGPCRRRSSRFRTIIRW